MFLAWTGPLATPAGTLPPTRRRGTVSGVMIVTLKDDLILREETYWNFPALIEQLTGQQAAA